MIDRGIKKWQPFNSCFSGKDILIEINKSKKQKDFPELSEDQILTIEEKVKDAYVLGTSIKIKYFYNGTILEQRGKINYIDMQKKKICLNNGWIYFKQILEIY